MAPLSSEALEVTCAQHDKRIALLEQSEQRDSEDFDELKENIKEQFCCVRQDIKEGFKSLSSSINTIKQEHGSEIRDLHNTIACIPPKVMENSLRTKITWGVMGSILLALLGVAVKLIVGV